MKKLALFLAFCTSPVVGYALPAFYGAEGGGAASTGGRGGSVCIVDRLADDNNSGSLRYCVNQSGPRTVVFRVGGTIKLNNTIWIDNPNITIAGQTAPGGGILLSGENIPTLTLFGTDASNVIVRFLRLRKGMDGALCPDDDESCRDDTLSIWSKGSGTSNIIIDHVSISWGTDENIELSAGGDFPLPGIPLTGVTFSWNLIAEALMPHSMGPLLGIVAGWNEVTTKVDLHHNFLSANYERNPLMTLGEGTFINNLVYNWKGGNGTDFRGGVTFDIIGNVYKQGPGSDSDDILFYPSCVDFCSYGCIQSDPSIYISGNLGTGESSVNVDNWPFIQGRADGPYCNSPGSNPFGLPQSWKRTNPLSTINPRAYPITVHHVFNDDLEDMILNDVGASKRLDCLGNWVSNRDSVDQRQVSQYRNNTGNIPTHVNDVGGFPTIAGGTPCADADNDGMPNEWEVAMGLNPNNDADRNTLHSSGYTMLEMYLNGPMEGLVLTLAPPQNVRFSQ